MLSARWLHKRRNGYSAAAVPYSTPDDFPDLIAAMKAASAALRDADVPFLLGGGLAGWARGGPPTEHDVDLFLREEDAERALGGTRRHGHEDGTTARGLALQGVPRRHARRPHLPAVRRADRGRALRARRGARRHGATGARRLARRRHEHEAAVAHRAGARLLERARARAFPARADRLGRGPRAHGVVTVRSGLLHPDRGARRRRAGPRPRSRTSSRPPTTCRR